MPFNVYEGIGVVIRSDPLARFVFWVGMFPIVVGFSIGLVFYSVGCDIGEWAARVRDKVVDELDDDDFGVGSEESSMNTDELARLLPEDSP
jgi:hypothetical protein